jgi:predicted ribonuclease YlaK
MHHFPLSLPRAVRNSFQIGVTSIMAEASAATYNEDKKFLLLPGDGNHDIAIFDASSQAIGGPLLDETPPPVKSTVHKPPVFFLGRNAKVQECISLLHPPQRYRCVTIRGEAGIGKSALAFRACEYMAERRMFTPCTKSP